MGKKLIIRGADFSQNGFVTKVFPYTIPGTDYRFFEDGCYFRDNAVYCYKTSDGAGAKWAYIGLNKYKGMYITISLTPTFRAIFLTQVQPFLDVTTPNTTMSCASYLPNGYTGRINSNPGKLLINDDMNFLCFAVSVSNNTITTNIVISET